MAHSRYSSDTAFFFHFSTVPFAVLIHPFTHTFRLHRAYTRERRLVRGGAAFVYVALALCPACGGDGDGDDEPHDTGCLLCPADIGQRHVQTQMLRLSR